MEKELGIAKFEFSVLISIYWKDNYAQRAGEIKQAINEIMPISDALRRQHCTPHNCYVAKSFQLLTEDTQMQVWLDYAKDYVQIVCMPLNSECDIHNAAQAFFQRLAQKIGGEQVVDETTGKLCWSKIRVRISASGARQLEVLYKLEDFTGGKDGAGENYFLTEEEMMKWSDDAICDHIGVWQSDGSVAEFDSDPKKYVSDYVWGAFSTPLTDAQIDTLVERVKAWREDRFEDENDDGEEN